VLHTEYGVKFLCKDFGFCRVRHAPVAPLRLQTREKIVVRTEKPRHFLPSNAGGYCGGHPKRTCSERTLNALGYWLLGDKQLQVRLCLR